MPREIEELRMAVLQYLVERRPLAFAADSIATHLARRQSLEFAFSERDIVYALEYLSEQKCVAHPGQDGMGHDRFWSATMRGIRTWEKSPEAHRG